MRVKKVDITFDSAELIAKLYEAVALGKEKEVIQELIAVVKYRREKVKIENPSFFQMGAIEKIDNDLSRREKLITNGSRGGRPAKAEPEPKPKRNQNHNQNETKMKPKNTNTDVFLEEVMKTFSEQAVAQIKESGMIAPIADWFNYKQKSKHKYRSPLTARTAAVNIIKWSEGDPAIAKDGVNFAIGNGYQGLVSNEFERLNRKKEQKAKEEEEQWY